MLTAGGVERRAMRVWKYLDIFPMPPFSLCVPRLFLVAKGASSRRADARLPADPRMPATVEDVIGKHWP